MWRYTLSKKPAVLGNPCLLFQYSMKSPYVCTHFLNAILDFKGDEAIEKVTYLDRLYPSSNENDFTVDLTVRCSTRNGRHFHIEMQNDYRDEHHLQALL